MERMCTYCDREVCISLGWLLQGHHAGLCECMYSELTSHVRQSYSLLCSIPSPYFVSHPVAFWNCFHQEAGLYQCLLLKHKSESLDGQARDKPNTQMRIDERNRLGVNEGHVCRDGGMG